MSDSRSSMPRPEWEPSWTQTPPSVSKSRSPIVAGISVFLSLLVGGVVAVAAYSASGRTQTALWVTVGAVIGSLLAGMAGVIGVFGINRRSSPASLRVAILGLPQVGKTTLITACFHEIFSRRVNISAVMSGSRSFEMLNDNIGRLASGLPLRPTRDQDLAAYRFEVPPSGFLTQRYRVEFGDFPGEDTKKYIEEYGPWIHATPFFEWALTCDAFVFCIDAGPLTAKYKSGISGIAGEYVGQSSAMVRAAWQHIVTSFGPRRSNYIRRSPVLLTFTKLDLFFRENEEKSAPKLIEVSAEDVGRAQEWLRFEYSDLIRYLEGETSHFSVVATSSFATTLGARLGISDFLRGVLPRQAFARDSR